MNHHGLFLKFMQRKVPVNLLCVIENWFNTCMTCVRWCSTISDAYCLLRGIRQGGVLSPYLFALYINDIISGVAFPDIICDCQQFFNFPDVSERILKRKTNFMNGLSVTSALFPSV